MTSLAILLTISAALASATTATPTVIKTITITTTSVLSFDAHNPLPPPLPHLLSNHPHPNAQKPRIFKHIYRTANQSFADLDDHYTLYVTVNNIDTGLPIRKERAREFCMSVSIMENNKTETPMPSPAPTPQPDSSASLPRFTLVLSSSSTLTEEQGGEGSGTGASGPGGDVTSAPTHTSYSHSPENPYHAPPAQTSSHGGREHANDADEHPNHAPPPPSNVFDEPTGEEVVPSTTAVAEPPPSEWSCAHLDLAMPPPPLPPSTTTTTPTARIVANVSHSALPIPLKVKTTSGGTRTKKELGWAANLRY